MSQTIHIFKKDVRRFSWEIVLSLLLLALYGWCQPVLWKPLDSLSFDGATATALRYMGASSLGMLLVLGWMVMLVRLIYDESLTDDRQFWITRPYRWHNLLAAKILFVLSVINLPLMAVQLCLLAAAGFAPFQHVARAAYVNLQWAGLLLAVATLAVVTGGRRQMTRAIILVLIFLVAGMWLGQSISFISISRYSEFSRPLLWQWLQWAVMLAVPIIVIVRQYALRKTAQARWILTGAGLALVLLAVAEPKPRFPEAEYAPRAMGTEGTFEINMSAPENPHAGHLLLGRVPERGAKTVWITFSFSGGEVAEGMLAQAEAIKITLLAPDGARWNSDWQPITAVLNHNENGTIDASALQLRKSGHFHPAGPDILRQIQGCPNRSSGGSCLNALSRPVWRDIHFEPTGVYDPRGGNLCCFPAFRDLDIMPLAAGQRSDGWRKCAPLQKLQH